MSYNTLSLESGYNPGNTQHKQFRGFIGTSVAMQAAYEKIENAAHSDETVFITGESGTGKKVCAQAIHRLGNCAHKPFISVNCATMSDYEGALRQAVGGTLFLDEITEMDPGVQCKLLQFLEGYSFQKAGNGEQADIRIICATNRNPLAEIAKRLFRQDLYYRLHVLSVYMPPLRERGEDVLDIALTLLRQYSHEEGRKFKAFGENAEFLLSAYHWPGNIRELQNIIKNIVVMNDEDIVTDDMLPQVIVHDKRPPFRCMEPTNSALSVVAGASASPAAQFVKPLVETEREAIEYAIAYCNGNIPNAAALLEVAPSTIYRKKSAWDSQSKAPA